MKMGKRKYEIKKGNSPKKTKLDEQELVIDDANGKQPQSSPNETKISRNVGQFDIKHFRKELAAKQGQTMVLTQFLQVCLNPDNEDVDYLLQYLNSGGNSHEILRQVNQENKKNLSLATPAFHLFHLIILKVQSSIPHMIAITEEACRYFLNNFMPTVEIMISENSGPRHRKIVLKLLTSMVTLNSDLGIEVLSQAPLTPKHLQYITEKPNYKEKDNVRTAFVHFMTAFLVDGHLPLIKALLEKQGLLALVIPGLVHDDAEAVLFFLNILKKNVIDNPFISKSLKLKTFSHQVLHNVFKLFSWKGPPETSNEIRNELRPEIVSLLSDVLLTLFTSHKLGLYFADNSLGTTDVNKNQNLYKALLTLKRPWEDENERKLILEIVYKCPDLHRALISVIEQSFEPQHSPIWERATDFVVKLLDTLKPEDMVSRMIKLTAAQVSNFVRFVTLPLPLLKFVQRDLGKDQSISMYCIKVLVKMLQMLRRYMQILGMQETQTQIADLRNKLEYFFPKHMPAPTTVVTLIGEIIKDKDKTENHQDYRLPKLDKTESLTYLVDLLLLYNDIQPAFFETLEDSIDMKKILDYSMTLSSGNTSLLKFKVVSLWLTLDNSAISVKNPMFKELFLIMLEVYTSNIDDTWIQAKETLYNFFRNTNIFEADEDEIHSVLYSLRNSKVDTISLIGDIVEYVLTNIDELNSYIRDQLVNFEFSCDATETSLDQLFNDLMEGKNTEDNVYLENKTSTPFIVGCTQYLQMNKVAKKNLKHFLSLYVSTLLHSNYSPELTEILIGDLKLDVRAYTTSWVSEPVPLPNNIIESKNTLNGLSNSIIIGEDIPLNKIFHFLEEVSQEESDIMVNNGFYKFNTNYKVDSSELLVWAKYLIFSVVRLTVMGKLQKDQQNKITDYFQLLIWVGKKLHMIDVCRSIILSLFKNPYVLKIYKPFDSKGDETALLATNFLTEIIQQHTDIVNYLDKKHKILKTYQQKNCSELVKVFIKINKRKNLVSEHTMRVLEVIGLTKEDDLVIFNKIFNTEILHCVKDDKEPSIVLELMQALIDKYSKTLKLELPEHILRKSMKLYSELLTNKDITVNLTNLENSFVRYLENKPHEVSYLIEDIFRKFFYVTNIRKSTLALASVLLKFSFKFTNIFKEEMSKAEILAQRELTLPLGNAVINHKQFLISNKDFLAAAYNEYKSNIMKLIEKPHKAGQVYINSSKFIQKLVLECMESQDCQKVFLKSHKFEVVDLSHVKLLEIIFLKMCLFEDGCNKDYFINFMLSMLYTTSMALKENKEFHIVTTVISSIYNIIQVCKSIEKFNMDHKNEFEKVTESAIWQNFCKIVLKDSLKVKKVDQGSTPGPQLLFLLSTLVKLLYPSDHQDIVQLFDMVTSHSEFLNVMLSYHSSDIKSCLIQFLYTLIQTNKSVIKLQQIPVFLSAYHATMSPCDRLIMSILHYYESNGQPVNEYKPYVFGDSAANHYAVRKNRTSTLWGHPTPNRVLNLFEKDIIERTVRNFPVNQKLEYHYELPSNIGDTYGLLDKSLTNTLTKMVKEGIFKSKPVKDKEGAVKALVIKGIYEKLKTEISNDPAAISLVDSDESIYDPMFLFPLLSHLLAPGSVASCFKLLRTGLLSVPVMALSSHCPLMRAAAYHVLHRFCMLLETETKHKNDKLFLTDFINTLRQSLSSAITNGAEDGIFDAKNPRLPAIDALYLARALMVSTAPSDPLYKLVNNFFIAKQSVDLTVIPDFLNLFHDSEIEHSERRLWILDVIKDGTKTMTDVNVIFKTMCLKMIMDFYSCVLSDRRVQEKILGVLSSLVAIPRAFEILVEGYGLMSWLNSAASYIGEDKLLVVRLLALIKNMLISMTVNAFSKNISSGAKNGKNAKFGELKINKDIENEIMHVLYELLQHTKCLDLEDVVSYVSVYSLLSKRTVKLLTKNQILTLVTRCSMSVKDSESVKLLTRALVANDVNILSSKNIVASNVEIKDNLITELNNVVRNYIL